MRKVDTNAKKAKVSDNEDESETELDMPKAPQKTPSNPWSFSSIKCVLILALSIILPTLFTAYITYNVNNLQKLEPVKYNDVIFDAPSYKWFKLENFFQESTVERFKEIFFSGDSLSTVIEDSDYNNVESAGEAVEVGDVDCRHPFMTLNLNRTMCHFSNRLGKINIQYENTLVDQFKFTKLSENAV